MQKLGEAISGWRPFGGPAGDPLATIRGAWSDIVGEDTARAAQPVALSGTGLVIVTASGAWSHQLSFLERNIIARIHALGLNQVERLRFRVGTIRRPAAPGAARRRGGPAGIPAATAARPADADEALGRLRAVVEVHRAAHRSAGGAFCSACGAPTGAGPMCAPCASDAGGRIRDACSRLLFEAPWLDAETVIGSVPGLDAEAYDRIRRSCLRSWVDELRLARKRHAAGAPVDRGRVRRLASSYVLLETRIDPNRLELESPVRRNALGDLYPFIREVETDPPAPKIR